MLAKRGLPFDPDGKTNAVATGDLDGDGDLDLAVAQDQGLRIYRNDSGAFVDATGSFPPAAFPVSSVAIGDLDGDGDLDLVFSSASRLAHVYLNSGVASFTDVTATHAPQGGMGGSGSKLALGDVDGDGDADLVVGGGYNTQCRLLINNGSGVFTDQTARLPTANTTTRSLALGDLDGDGDLDLVLGNWGNLIPAATLIYLNNGAGTFQPAGAALPPGGNRANAIALGDVDGDGDLDLLVGNELQTYVISTGQTRLYLNNGAGTFVEATAQLPVNGTDRTRAFALRDFDGDGDMDLMIGNDGANRLWANNGAGVFTDITVGHVPTTLSTTAFATGDFDGDGDADVVVGNSGSVGQQDRYYRNDSTARFVDAAANQIVPLDVRVFAIAHGDLDGDGDEDLVVGGATGIYSPFRARLYRNDGNGVLTDVSATNMVAPVGNTQAIAVGDIDSDGDLDLVLGINGQQNRLLRNNGAGVFTDITASGLPAAIESTRALAFGDVDGDGDLDLVVANSAHPTRVLLNNGTGVFTPSTGFPATNVLATSLALGDLDGDGDLDLAVGVSASYFAHSGALNRLFLNNGTGTFTDVSATRLPAHAEHTTSLALGDLDGDGDLDLVVGNTNAYYVTGTSRIYRNDGTATFTDVTAGRLPTAPETHSSLALGDIDQDGDLDLLVGNGLPFFSNFPPVQNHLYLNDGAGTFAEVTAARTTLGSDPRGRTSVVTMIDLDRDGDLDFVVGRTFAESGTTLQVHTNLLRQIDSPDFVTMGRTWHLDAYARFGPPRLFDAVLAYYSFQTASIPLPPLGTIGIDPNAMFALSPFLVAQPDGLGTLSIPVPNVAALAGTPVHVQALLVQYPVQDRLTNVLTETIVR